MDSSPDLSLKLRRGSNDSRDSYYMDFAQGIDSDIEEVATIATAVEPAAVIAASPSPPPQQPPPPIVQQPSEDLTTQEDVTVISNSDSTSLPSLPSLPPTIDATPALSNPLVSSITNSTENNNSTTDDDEDMSQITPLPMPILPPIQMPPIQMLSPKIPDDDDEG